ncbi:hypothetical protein H5410_060850 [Solanum commersonii]|uniref:Uncharacterized protein n=1 Tax=Solanum commersonii TaxID=4109 RepID=A0A9J5W789_SOLCO|nr:hypothetical protein H5410_060850 [Solanum commersonii]
MRLILSPQSRSRPIPPATSPVPSRPPVPVPVSLPALPSSYPDQSHRISVPSIRGGSFGIADTTSCIKVVIRYDLFYAFAGRLEAEVPGFRLYLVVGLNPLHLELNPPPPRPHPHPLWRTKAWSWRGSYFPFQRTSSPICDLVLLQ